MLLSERASIQPFSSNIYFFFKTIYATVISSNLWRNGEKNIYQALIIFRIYLEIR